MGSFYRSKHELVFVFKIGTAPHTNSFGLGETGRYRTNVWDYAGVNTFRAGRVDELAMHPTVKPVALIADAIKDWLPARRDRTRPVWRLHLGCLGGLIRILSHRTHSPSQRILRSLVPAEVLGAMNQLNLKRAWASRRSG
jgi:hypothetical protein